LPINIISKQVEKYSMQWLGWLAAGAITCLAYEKLPSETKQKWENAIKSHHGEWGLVGVAGGLATGNPSLAAFSAGLTLHDWPDKNKWFTGGKKNNHQNHS